MVTTSSNSPGKWSQFFNPICCFLLFNVMDWLGRSLTSYFLWVSLSRLNQPEVWEVTGDQREGRNIER